MEIASFYLCCVHTTGCRYVQGCKVTTLETCCRGGGYLLCCANACGFPPDEKVPMGCGCCGVGLGFDKPMALEGTGLEWNDNEICCHYICCCQHGAIFKQVRILLPSSTHFLCNTSPSFNTVSSMLRIAQSWYLLLLCSALSLRSRSRGSVFQVSCSAMLRGFEPYVLSSSLLAVLHVRRRAVLLVKVFLPVEVFFSSSLCCVI